MTLQDQLAIIQAAIDGKLLQYHFISSHYDPCHGPVVVKESQWSDMQQRLSYEFNFQHYTYRVKPQPREWWLILDARGFWVAHQCITAGIEDQIHVREVLDE